MASDTFTGRVVSVEFRRKPVEEPGFGPCRRFVPGEEVTVTLTYRPDAEPEPKSTTEEYARLYAETERLAEGLQAHREKLAGIVDANWACCVFELDPQLAIAEKSIPSHQAYSLTCFYDKVQEFQQVYQKTQDAWGKIPGRLQNLMQAPHTAARILLIPAR